MGEFRLNTQVTFNASPQARLEVNNSDEKAKGKIYNL